MSPEDMAQLKGALTVGVRINDRQWEALDRIKQRGFAINPSSIGNLVLEDAIAAECTGETGMKIWLVIEADGHVHS